MGKWIQNKDANWRIPATGGWCLQYVRQAFGQPARYPDATAAWNANDFPRRTGQPPAGITVPVYFSLGSTKQGHVAIRLDDLMVASSTKAGTHPRGYLHPNIQDLIKMYAKYNKGCTYLGWKEGMGTTRFVTYHPTITTKDLKVDTTIAFKTETIKDPELAKGEVVTKQAGKNGVRTVVTRVTYSDGKESSRSVISDTTKEPTAQIIVVGTFVEAPIEPAPPVKEPVPEVPEPPVIPTPHIIELFLEWLINFIKGIWRK